MTWPATYLSREVPTETSAVYAVYLFAKHAPAHERFLCTITFDPCICIPCAFLLAYVHALAACRTQASYSTLCFCGGVNHAANTTRSGRYRSDDNLLHHENCFLQSGYTLPRLKKGHLSDKSGHECVVIGTIGGTTVDEEWNRFLTLHNMISASTTSQPGRVKVNTAKQIGEDHFTCWELSIPFQWLSWEENGNQAHIIKCYHWYFRSLHVVQPGKIVPAEKHTFLMRSHGMGVMSARLLPFIQDIVSAENLSRNWKVLLESTTKISPFRGFTPRRILSAWTVYSVD